MKAIHKTVVIKNVKVEIKIYKDKNDYRDFRMFFKADKPLWWDHVYHKFNAGGHKPAHKWNQLCFMDKFDICDHIGINPRKDFV